MSPHIETFAAAVSTMLAAIAGSKIGILIANVANNSMPEWMSWALGPFGALIGVVIALRWMAVRLATSEAREEKRRQERDEDRKATQETLIALVKDTNTVTTSAVEVMRAVNTTLEGCHKKLQ